MKKTKCRKKPAEVFGRRILSAALSLILCLSGLPVTAHAETGDVLVSSKTEFIAAVQKGGNVKLANDITIY